MLTHMSRAQVHFELFVRRKVDAPWTLELATEDRAAAVKTADELLGTGRVAAVCVTKETLNEETREFASLTVLAKGATEARREPKVRDKDDTPLCVAPQDLYSAHARERIARLFDGWLHRKSVTPFELLHRPDLVEQLEASGVEIQHAVQKIAIPEAQARGRTTHEMIRLFQSLADRAIERLLRDGRKNAFPRLSGANFAATAESLSEDPERGYLLGGGVASFIAGGGSWSEKVGKLLDLAECAPEAGRPRGLALQVLEQPLSEIVAIKGGLADLFGPDLDLGASLAAMTRVAAAAEVDALTRMDPSLNGQLPPLEGEAARLAIWLQREAFENVRKSLARRVVHELMGPRRLRPGDPDGEIDILRALAMTLMAAAPRLLPQQEVQDAITERSKNLVGSDFVGIYLENRASAFAEVEALVRLAENVVGGANKRAAARWIIAAVSALRFEKEMRRGDTPPAARLAALADLQKSIRRAGLPDADEQECFKAIGETGAMIEADTRFVALIGRSDASVRARLNLLLRLASGEAGPTGPVADRSRAEALRLLRQPEVRAELAANPEGVTVLRSLMMEVGLAA
jgi:hypothetical protein